MPFVYDFSLNENTLPRVKRETAVGSVTDTHTGVRLDSRGRLCFRLPAAERERILELRELHRRDDAAFCYTVTANGRHIYTRSYEPLANAPVSVFVRLPDDLPIDGEAEIGIENISDSPVFLWDARLHDLKLLEAAGQHPMDVGFFAPQLSRDLEKDCALIESMKAQFGNDGIYRMRFGQDLFYMSRTDDEMTDFVRYILTLSARTQVPLFLDLNTWWGGTPSGPDGQGGYFGDMEYNQVTYDSLTGNYALSVPNMWSNTPWLTMNHAVLNGVRCCRLHWMLHMLSKEIAAVRATQELPPVKLFIDNEPTYWASFAYTNNPDSGGDFCVAAVKAAEADGVQLRHAGPLNETDRLWMQKNLNTYIEQLSEAFYNGSDEEYAIVQNGTCRYSGRELAENTYTHVFPGQCYPYQHFRHPQWETHVTPWAKLGLEGCSWEDRRYFDYAIQFGRFGDINSERICYTDHTFHHYYYLFGGDSTMIFNYYPTDFRDTAATAHAGNAPYREPGYAAPVFEYDVFTRELKDPAVVSCDNLARRPYRNRWVWQPDVPGTGRIVLRVGRVGEYPHGALMELSAFVKPKNGGIRVWAGTSPEKLTAVCDLPQQDNVAAVILQNIPLAGYMPDEELLVGLEITSTTFDEDWAELNYVWFFRMLADWPLPAGHTDGFCFTYDEKRELSRMVIARAECQKLCSRYPELAKAVPPAEASVQYAERYARLRAVVSEKRTERFFLYDRGTLGRFPLTAETDRPVYLHLTPEGAGWQLRAEGEPGTKITFTGVSASPRGINRWHLTPAKGSSTVTVRKERLPDTCTGRLLATDEHRVHMQTQALADWHYQHKQLLPLTADTAYYLRQDGGTFAPAERKQLPPGSMVQAMLADGVVTALYCTVGRISGTVQAVEPRDFMAEARDTVVTVADDSGKTVSVTVARGCALEFTGAPDRDPLCCADGSLGLTVGLPVTVSYCPYCVNGRLPRADRIGDRDDSKGGERDV